LTKERRRKMKRPIVLSVLLFLGVMLAGVAWAGDHVIVNPFAAIKFTTMPEIANFPEGITANPDNGDIFVSTFEFDTTGTETNGVVRFNRHGHVDAKSDFSGNIPLLGLAFNENDYKVYIASVGNFQSVPSTIQRIAADFTDGATFEEVAIIPNIGPPLDPRIVENPDTSEDTIVFGDFAAVPNALAFRSSDDALFVSDSFQGAIFRIDNAHSCTTPCPVVTVIHHPLLATAGFPAFGANGITMSADEDALFVANTGDDRILRIPLNEDGSAAGVPTVFAESINGADGMAVDDHGNLWVAANQADQVVIVNRDGRVDAELGEFFGIRKNGAARGLSFPASIVIVGKNIFVTNLALPLTTVEGDEWEEKVSTYTVSRIRLPWHHSERR
jgi:hypothetical protein